MKYRQRRQPLAGNWSDNSHDKGDTRAVHLLHPEVGPERFHVTEEGTDREAKEGQEEGPLQGTTDDGIDRHHPGTTVEETTLSEGTAYIRKTPTLPEEIIKGAMNGITTEARKVGLTEGVPPVAPLTIETLGDTQNATIVSAAGAAGNRPSINHRRSKGTINRIDGTMSPFTAESQTVLHPTETAMITNVDLINDLRRRTL